ncbi:unnamed protein product [Lactuca saligna]|uniref:Uncharacterized protein n=1 Tax=Lactuca saligna TaxID=75948 RepID=A0AA35YRJ2_LACSI|nr:unnamed protein product [Lactuca saligna]
MRGGWNSDWSVVAGLATGALYKTAASPRSAAVAGAIGGIAVGLAMTGKQILKRYVFVALLVDEYLFSVAASSNLALKQPTIRVVAIIAGAFKIGDTEGIIDNIIQCKLYRPGYVGFVSKSFFCTKENEYNDLAIIFFNTQHLMPPYAAFYPHGGVYANPVVHLLARTCYNFYQSTPTKFTGENYFLHLGQLMFKSLFVIYTRWTTTNFLTWRICFLHDI